ncbi:unnamed protein product [Anisakis simplex]|uniref:DNA replication complex GINS protein SLD5 n=1 Tax=Anisakis simplex TaxID=6269 RepID=A0A0M3JY50_ANISI|nr:unnamed protein product [Anisakis simplex]
MSSINERDGTESLKSINILEGSGNGTDSMLEDILLNYANEGNSNEEEGNGDDEEAVTPAEVLAELTIAWQNELCAPALLPHRLDLIGAMVLSTEGMEENINDSRNEDPLKICVHKMEIHRIAYIINDYLRKRLEKIEKNAIRCLQEDTRKRINDREELLSDEERKFAEKYIQSTSQLLMNCVLGRLPEPLQQIPNPERDLSGDRVFVRVLEDDLEDVTIPDKADPNSESVNQLDKDSIYIVPYESIASHLANDKVRLL